MDFFGIDWLYLIGFTGLLLFCVLPLIFVGLIVFFGATRGRELLDQMVMPDPAKLEARFARLRRRHARLHPDQLVARIVFEESFKCGVVGFITGFGGIPLLPIMVPLDAVASMRIQAVMVQFIARAYGRVERSGDVERVKTYLILAGSRQLTTVTTVVIRRLFIKFFLKGALKVVPIIGGVIGFIANVLAANAIGQLAVRWYRGDLRQLGLTDLADTLIDQVEASPQLRASAGRVARRLERGVGPADER